MIGNYVAQDFDRAELYLRRAAAQNNETAITNLKNLKRLRKAKPG
jgi:TPR repeat protein